MSIQHYCTTRRSNSRLRQSEEFTNITHGQTDTQTDRQTDRVTSWAACQSQKQNLMGTGIFHFAQETQELWP